MPEEKQLTQGPLHFLRVIFDGWFQILARPNQENYLIQLSRSSLTKATFEIGALGVLAGVYLSIVGRLPVIFGFQNRSIGFLLVVFVVLAGFLAANLVILAVLKIFGGVGNYRDQSILLAMLVTPLGLIALVFLLASYALGLEAGNLLNPLSLPGILGGLMVLLLIYATILLLFTLQTVHRIKATRVLYALGTLVGIWAVARVAEMFANQEDTILTRLWAFLILQWSGGYMQEVLMNHIWLVVFSTLIAVIIGVVIGVLITMPARRPKLAHVVFVLPLVVFFLIWAASSGIFGSDLATHISTTMRTWDRSLRAHDGFFGEIFVILGAILRKPAAVGLIGITLTIIVYVLLLVGEKASELTLYIAGIILTIPSIALFGILIKPLGIGPFNAAFALILYAQLPILRNTYTGIKEIQPEIVEAGRGMGMTEFQLLREVKLPLAVPVIMTGLRVSLVMLVGIAAIAAFIGNDTLGNYIFTGISRAQDVRYITGAFVVAILAVIVDFILGLIQDRLTPLGLKERRKNA